VRDGVTVFFRHPDGAPSTGTAHLYPRPTFNSTVLAIGKRLDDQRDDVGGAGAAIVEAVRPAQGAAIEPVPGSLNTAGPVDGPPVPRKLGRDLRRRLRRFECAQVFRRTCRCCFLLATLPRTVTVDHWNWSAITAEAMARGAASSTSSPVASHGTGVDEKWVVPHFEDVVRQALCCGYTPAVAV